MMGGKVEEEEEEEEERKRRRRSEVGPVGPSEREPGVSRFLCERSLSFQGGRFPNGFILFFSHHVQCTVNESAEGRYCKRLMCVYMSVASRHSTLAVACAYFPKGAQLGWRCIQRGKRLGDCYCGICSFIHTRQTGNSYLNNRNHTQIRERAASQKVSLSLSCASWLVAMRTRGRRGHELPIQSLCLSVCLALSLSISSGA